MFEFALYAVSKKFPYVRRINPAGALDKKFWVRLDDGRPAIVDHVKPNGLVAVRPVNERTGEFFPNPSAHWSEEQRMKHPEELAVERSTLRDLITGQVVPSVKELEHV